MKVKDDRTGKVITIYRHEARKVLEILKREWKDDISRAKNYRILAELIRACGEPEQ